MPTNSQRVFTNTLIQSAGRITVLLLGLVSISLITRTLGVANYGVYTTATAFLSFFISLTDWGIPTVITRDLAQHEQDKDFISSAIIGRLFLAVPSAIFMVIVGFFVYRTHPQIAAAIAILSATLVFNGIISTLVAFFQSEIKMAWPTAAEVGARIASLGVIWYAAVHNHGLFFILGAAVLGSLIQCVLLITAFRRRSDLRLKFDRLVFRKILVRSLPIGAAIVISGMYFKIDTVILSFLRSPHEVGIYGAAYKVLELVLLFPSLFATITLPVLAKRAAEPDGFNQALQKALDFILLLGIPIAAGGWVVASQVISLIGGHAFLAASSPLRILLFSAVLTGINIVAGQAVIALHRQKQAMYLNAAVLVLNIILNYLTIPRFGYIAAAWNTLASEVFVLGVNLAMLRKFSSFRLGLYRAFPILVAAAGMSMIVFAVHNLMPVLVTIPLAGICYAVLILVLRIVTVDELKELVISG